PVSVKRQRAGGPVPFHQVQTRRQIVVVTSALTAGQVDRTSIPRPICNYLQSALPCLRLLPSLLLPEGQSLVHLSAIRSLGDDLEVHLLAVRRNGPNPLAIDLSIFHFCRPVSSHPVALNRCPGCVHERPYLRLLF